MATDLPVVLRKLRQSDYAFVLDSWINSLSYLTDQYFFVPKNVLKKYRGYIKQLLICRPDLFLVLANEDDDNHTFGWVCGDLKAVHFLYVKKCFRRMGLGRLLLARCNPRILTHWTRPCEYLEAQYKPSIFLEVLRGIDQTRYCEFS